MKLKSSQTEWHTDQIEALNWAKTVLDKMDPHTKEDIHKFQEKLSKIDKDMDKTNRVVLAASVDFY